MRERKIFIGLTGGISGGKSVAAAAFKKCGALVIDADKLAAKYYALNESKIQKYFDGADRAAVAADVFKSAAKRKWLEALLHPLILKEAQTLAAQTPAKIVVFEAPLLFESGLKNMFDLTLAIYAVPTLAQRRTHLRAADFKARAAAQLPPATKAQMADIVIFNEGSKKDLETKISKLYKTLKEEKNGK